MAERGFELKTLTPKVLDPAAEVASYHVIVSLQGTVQSHVEVVPFHAIALEWEVGDTSDGRFEDLYRMLATLNHELMTTLHGGEGGA